MKVSLFGAIIISAVVTTLVLVIVNLILKGEPRLVQAGVTGTVISVANMLVLNWRMKRKKESDSSDSAESA